MIKRITSYLAMLLLLALGAWAVLLWNAAVILDSNPTPEGYAQALRWDPNSDSTHAILGTYYRDALAAQALTLAIRELQKSVYLKPGVWTHHMDLAIAQEMAGEFAAAELSMQEALRLNPRQTDARWQAANFYLRRGRFPEAIAMFHAAVDASPDRRAFAADRMISSGISAAEIADWAAPPESAAPRVTIGRVIAVYGGLSVSGCAAAPGTTLFAGDDLSTDSGIALLALTDGRRVLLSAQSKARSEFAEGRPAITGVAGKVYDSANPDSRAGDRLVFELAVANPQRGLIAGDIKPRALAGFRVD